MGELHEQDEPTAETVRAAFARLAAAMEQAIRDVAPRGTDSAQLCAALMASIAGMRTLQQAGFPLRQRRQAALRLAQALAAG